MQNTVTNELAALKNSVTFAMSLGAKELFHTNFIAFLLENDDPSLIQIRDNLASLFFHITPSTTFSTSTRFYTWREKFNLDLVIIAIDWINHTTNEVDGTYSADGINNAYVCVIEAKLKSIPTLVQLDEYDQKLKNGLKFDLNDSDYLQSTVHGLLIGFQLKYDQVGGVQTLMPIYGTRINNKHIINPVVFKKILLSQVTLPICKCTSLICTCTPVACKWNQKNWNDIYQAIQAGIVNIKSSNAVLITIVKDYIDHLNNLASLITGVITYSQQKFTTLAPNTPNTPNTPINYITLCNGINGNGFKALRIHDLVGKVVFNDLELRLLSAINPCQTKLVHKTFYSNQQPGIDFEWYHKDPRIVASKKSNSKKIEKAFRIGVEIQGSDYRHYIATNTSWKGLVKLSASPTLSPWFSAQILGVHGKNLGRRPNGDLYKFNQEKFLYSKMPLDIEDFDQLSHYIKKSMDLACGIMTSLILSKELDHYFN